MRTIRVIFVPAGGLDPEQQPEVREVEDDLHTLQRLVAGPGQDKGWLECLGLDEGIDCYMNEEGRLIGLSPNRLVDRSDGAQFDINGDFFLAGSNDQGDIVSLSPDLEADWLQRMKEAPVAIFM